MGTFYVNSIRWVYNWKYQNCFQNKEEYKLRQKYLNSCRPLYFKVGSLGKINKATSIKIIGKIVFYTGKFTLAFNKSNNY